MTSKQSLTVAVVLIAITITMLIAAAYGDPEAYGCQGDPSRARGAVLSIGYYGWQQHENFDPTLVSDEDDDDCSSSMWSDDDDCEPDESSYGYDNNRAYRPGSSLVSLLQHFTR